MFFENREEFGKFTRIVVADASFYGKSGGDLVAEESEEGVNFCEIAEESAAGVFAADDGCGAAEVEVDACDGVRKKFFDELF